jgi:hypothetical protein
MRRMMAVVLAVLALGMIAGGGIAQAKSKSCSHHPHAVHCPPH